MLLSFTTVIGNKKNILEGTLTLTFDPWSQFKNLHTILIWETTMPNFIQVGQAA